jgi:hypothetical protein
MDAFKPSTFAGFVWIAGISLAIVWTSAQHIRPIPRAFQANQNPPESLQWVVEHILVEGCPCSAAMADHFVQRGLISFAGHQLKERVWSVKGNITPDWIAKLSQSGFELKRESSAVVHMNTGVYGGPWLKVTNPQGQVVYSGGYMDQRPGTTQDKPLDVQIVTDLILNRTSNERPAFGCSVR